jgi:hypothetical protein
MFGEGGMSCIPLIRHEPQRKLKKFGVGLKQQGEPIGLLINIRRRMHKQAAR